MLRRTDLCYKQFNVSQKPRSFEYVKFIQHPTKKLLKILFLKFDMTHGYQYALKICFVT